MHTFEIGFFTNGTSTRKGLLNTKAILKEEKYWYYLNHSWVGVDQEVQPYSKGSSPKVNLVARLEFELVFYDITVMHANHNSKNLCKQLIAEK